MWLAACLMSCACMSIFWTRHIEDLKTGLQMVLRDSSVHAVAGGPGDFQSLMNVKATIYNWDLYQQRSLAYGWHKNFSSNLCHWTGVSCREGSVAQLKFPTNASYLQGAPPQFFSVASHHFWMGDCFSLLPQMCAAVGRPHLQGIVPGASQQTGASSRMHYSIGHHVHFRS